MAAVNHKTVSTNTFGKIAAPRKRHILVVDDHPVNRIFARKLLAKIGFENVDTSKNGVQALAMIEKKKYALVLMDCQMAEMDGYEATRLLRGKEKDTHLPVIAVTANAMLGDREKCLNAGMDDYLSKPLKRDNLQMMLERWLTKTTSTEACNTTSEDVVSLESNVIDLQHLAMFTDGDLGEERELFELFIEQAVLTMETLSDSLNDNEEWQRAAHKFTGSAANFGATALAASCKQAELSHKKERREKEVLLNEIREKLQQVEQFASKRYA